MSDVTRARDILAEWVIDNPDVRTPPRAQVALVQVLAAALAEERRKAREPFLALAAEYERHVDLMDVSLYNDVTYKIQAFQDAAASIRRAAEKSGE